MGRASSAHYSTEPLITQARLKAAAEGVPVNTYIRQVMTVADEAALWRRRAAYWVADRLACHLGLHPLNVWPDWGRHEKWEEAA